MAVVPTPRSDSAEIGKNIGSEVVTRLIICSTHCKLLLQKNGMISMHTDCRCPWEISIGLVRCMTFVTTSSDMNNATMRQKKSLKITWPLRRAERPRKNGDLHEAESDADTSITQFFPDEPKTNRDYDQDQYMFLILHRSTKSVCSTNHDNGTAAPLNCILSLHR